MFFQESKERKKKKNSIEEYDGFKVYDSKWSIWDQWT